MIMLAMKDDDAGKLQIAQVILVLAASHMQGNSLRADAAAAASTRTANVSALQHFTQNV